VLKWVTRSESTGRSWVVANDEQNPASLGVPCDPGYNGFSGVAREKSSDRGYTIDDIRKATLWGTLLAGGQGVEYYFGYTLPANDLNCEDYRSRDKSWDYCRIALDFFRREKVPFWDMKNADALVGNTANDNSRYCFAQEGRVYVVYLPSGGTAELDLSGTRSTFKVRWFDPRNGGGLATGSLRAVRGGGRVSLGNPPSDPDQDWVVLVR
jgi:hypothetical protein